MRILHFAGTYFPVMGGTTTRIHSLIADPSHAHVLYVPFDRQEPSAAAPDGEQFGHIRVVRVRSAADAWHNSMPFLSQLGAARRLVEAAAHENADLIHGHGPLTCAIASRKTRERTRWPMVYEAHTILRDFTNIPRILGGIPPFQALAATAAGRMLGIAERRVIAAADAVIAQTESARRRIEALYRIGSKPVVVIPNGVDVETFDPERWRDDGRRIRAERGWGDHIVILYAGYLDRINGLEFLNESIEELPAKLRGRIKIVLIGRGPLEALATEMARRHPDLVEYLGVVPFDRMPIYYAACDVFMIPRPPYRPGETMIPMKLFEAMAMERVLLVSDVAAMAEIIKDGQNGFVFRKGDRADFIRGLERAAHGSEPVASLGPTARSQVLLSHSWRRSRELLYSLYDQTLRGSRS